MNCEIKALQLDLARQKENIPQIKEIFSLAAKYGYNTIFLYLEDRIKTKTYSLRSDEESYNTDEVREIVDYASSLKLDIIPIVPNLGHTERFLENKELSHLAELHGNLEGRFNDEGNASYKVICPSKKESYEFFDAYLTEVAELFPSKYFHAGLDESFDVGFCEVCRKRRKAEGFGGIFLKHILHTHKLLKGLGKTMMMWDDMIEFAPEILTEIPKDIVLCTWFYRYVKKYPTAQFCNNKTSDIFREYEDLGFEYIAGTNAGNILNVKTFTDYAKTKRPLGMLNTVWERKPRPLTDMYINFIYGGMLWNDKFDGLNLPESVDMATTELLGNAVIPSAAFLRIGADTDNNYFTAVSGNVQRTDERYAVNLCLLNQINENIKSLSGEKWELAKAVAFNIEKSVLLYDIKQAALKIYDFRTGVAKTNKSEVKAILDKCRITAEEMLKFQLNLWEKKRSQLPGVGNEMNGILKNIALLEKSLNESSFAGTGRLDVSFCLPDEYGGPKCKIRIIYDDCEETVANGTFKYYCSEKAFYTFSFPINAHKPVRKCQIAVSGFGGQGFTYIEAKNQTGIFTPKAITDVYGEVEHPCNILKNDLQWCWLGNTDMKYTIDNPRHSKLKNLIEIEF